MATVNDFMKFLNDRLGVNIPLLPLKGFPAFLTDLWKAAVRGWTRDQQQLPGEVEIDLGQSGLPMPLGRGEVTIDRASIRIRDGSPSSP